MQHVAPVHEFPADKWHQVISINLDAPFHAIKAALPDMKKRGWGARLRVAVFLSVRVALERGTDDFGVFEELRALLACCVRSRLTYNPVQVV